MESVFAKVATLPHVAGVISPYSRASGGKAISADGKIAFATVVFDQKANILPKQAPERVVNVARAGARPGLEVELGGQAIELTEQEGFGIATGVGLLAAIVVLLLTFGSLTGDGSADRHCAVRPRHRPERDRPVHARRGHAELLLGARGDDRPGRRDRLRAVHPDALPRGLPTPRGRRSRTCASPSCTPWTRRGARWCSPARPS